MAPPSVHHSSFNVILTAIKVSAALVGQLSQIFVTESNKSHAALITELGKGEHFL